MTTPEPLRADPDLLRSIASSWHRSADSLGRLDPGGAVASGSISVPTSATAQVMGNARVLNTAITRSVSRLRVMAKAAVETADITGDADYELAETLRRIDGIR